MAKRQEIEVDEDLIKSMMTGDIPRLNNPSVEEKKNRGQKEEVPEPKKKDEKETKDETEEESLEKNTVSKDSQDSNKEKETSQSKSKRKKEPKDYPSLFLKKSGSNKRQTYVSAVLYDKIAKILGIIAKDISVPNFIDNVLENHLNEYKEEINDIYKNNLDLTI